jgi:PLP dependent protein
VTPSDVRTLLQDRLAAVEDRIAAACRRSGRPRAAVTLVAVTKTVGPDVAALLPELGVTDLGENRPQELWRKAAAVPGPVRWHLIGHLQRNKAARTVPLSHLIHSVDSDRLLDTLDDEATRLGRAVSVLLEVNASGEAQKGGFAPDGLPALVDQLTRLRNVQVLGLMTMAAFEADPERCRPTFVALRQLRDRLSGRLPSPHRLDQLSMGMTNDFEVAVEEGATLVRIGTALFEGLEGTVP